MKVITQTKEISFFNYAWTVNNGGTTKQTNYHLLIFAGQRIMELCQTKEISPIHCTCTVYNCGNSKKQNIILIVHGH